ncbi:MAG: HEAT repeat domain-containing protein [Synechococcus sp. SB0665_bin_28]|nr:HEAT repeat domain-containing protein [Synechococcus sp. SB0665_bin_28]MYF20320.1 HEAT repeat domain-containing protein [Synechococcus sp. SB0677_bin_5]
MPSTPPDSRQQVQALVDAVQAAQTADDLTDAVEDLSACAHPMAIPCLIQVLGFNNPGAAVAAVDGLVAIGAAAVPAILANLDEYNYGARAWSVRALAGIGDLRGLPLLERALAQDIGPSVRRAAARGMGALQPHGFTAQQRQELAERILPQLKAACGDEEWIVRYAVAVGLEGMDHWWQPPAAQRHRLLDALQPLADPQREAAPVVWLRARLALNRLVTAASAARA